MYYLQVKGCYWDGGFWAGLSLADGVLEADKAAVNSDKEWCIYRYSSDNELSISKKSLMKEIYRTSKEKAKSRLGVTPAPVIPVIDWSY